MLINNTIYCFANNYTIAYSIDFIFGNSIIFTIFIFMISYRFNYCVWHRILIIGNLINLLIANIDAWNRIDISDLSLLLIYYIVAAIFVIIAAYTHIKQIHYERKTKNT